MMPSLFFNALKWCRTGLVALPALLAACATPVAETPPIPSLSGQPAYEIDDVDLLGMSTEMNQFVTHHISSGGPGRAWSLAYASLDPNLLAFNYDPGITLTASEAFRTRTGNCLTFSNLFIAMARSAGLEAWYREVKTAPEWNSVDDTLLVSMHVNAAVRERGKEYIIDVSRRKPHENEAVRRLSDREAAAQFYNNLGADALIDGNLAMAYAYFGKALALDRNLPYVWSNLGVVLRRNGQTGDAMLAYETALALDPQHDVALNNLYAMHDEDGNTAEAEALRARVERNRERNPYYLHHMARTALTEARWDDALNLARRAIRLEENDYRFYYTLAQAHFGAGEYQLADSSLGRARRMAPPGVDKRNLSLPGTP